VSRTVSMPVQRTYMCNAQNNVARPVILPLDPEPQAASTSDTDEKEDVAKPQPRLVVVGSHVG
jgi:hypothetical protein